MRRLAALPFLTVLALGVSLGAHPARAEGVALTYDDLPELALTDSVPYSRITTTRLLAGLHRHRIRAMGFVVGDKLDGGDRKTRLAMLEAWLQAGQALGNHTYDHDSLNETPIDDYLASVARDDALLRQLLARRRRAPQWFRHPYLETGATVKTRHALDSWLHTHHYRVAPVTLENSDWMFALPYDEAVLAGHDAEARRIRRAYVAYTDQCVGWYRKAARQLLGRRPALVFLLHSSRINADSVDDVAAVLHRHHLRPVSLARAMRDPAYAMPDGRPDKAGDEWLTRWSDRLHRPLPWDSFPEPPADIAAADKRLDDNP